MPTYARLALVHVTAPLAVANVFCGSTVTDLTTRLLTLTPPLALAAGAQSVVASRTHTSANTSTRSTTRYCDLPCVTVFASSSPTFRGSESPPSLPPFLTAYSCSSIPPSEVPKGSLLSPP
jgi:hypothetical protein